MIGIYKITNKINNKTYIGQSKDIQRRWKQHINNSKNIKHSSYFNPLYVDFRKYGIENFDFEILQTFEKYNKIELDKAELSFMKKFNTLQNGYNILASTGQKIVLENIETNTRVSFLSFAEVEKYLHDKNITRALHLKPFLIAAIKQKKIIYLKYRIYYWKENTINE